MSLEVKNPLFYWSRFIPGVMPSGDRRIHIIGKFNDLGNPVSIETRGLNSSNQVQRFNGPYPMQEMLTSYEPNIDGLTVASPISMLNDGHYQAYKSRLGIVNSEYGEMIKVLSGVVDSELKKHKIRPHAFVAIPTRKEVSTSRAINVIRQNFSNSGITPYFIVLHNDTASPPSNTMADLEKIRNEKDVFVIDLMFSNESNIGDARAIPADIIMEINFQNGSNIPMITADADITKVKPQTYKNMIIGIDHNFTAVTAFTEFDPETIKDHETFYVAEKAKAIYFRVLERIKVFHPGLVGVGFAMNMKVLPVLGGIPRANQLEDLLLEYNIKHNRSVDSLVGIPINCGETLSDGSRHANAMLTGGRYLEFETIASNLRTATIISPLDLDRVIPIINQYIEQSLGLLNKIPEAGVWLKATLKLYFSKLCSDHKIPTGDGKVKLELLD